MNYYFSGVLQRDTGFFLTSLSLYTVDLGPQFPSDNMTMKLMEDDERSFSCPLKHFPFLTPGTPVMQLQELKHSVLNLAWLQRLRLHNRAVKQRCNLGLAELYAFCLKSFKNNSFSFNVSA